MREILIAAFIVGCIVSAFLFKSWQCYEMFPDESLLACFLWR